MSGRGLVISCLLIGAIISNTKAGAADHYEAPLLPKKNPPPPRQGLILSPESKNENQNHVPEKIISAIINLETRSLNMRRERPAGENSNRNFSRQIYNKLKSLNNSQGNQKRKYLHDRKIRKIRELHQQFYRHKDQFLRHNINSNFGLRMRDESGLPNARDAGAASKKVEWIAEPQQQLIFSNNSGAILNCLAEHEGVALATNWFRGESLRPVHQVANVLDVLSNGSLFFLPFSPHYYDGSVHNSEYTCKVSSSVGTLVSVPTKVTAIIGDKFEVRVFDEEVMTGNTAKLTCQLPMNVRDFLGVTSWLVNDEDTIYPSLYGDGKYHMTEEGFLYIHSVTHLDSRNRFRCRFLNALSGQSKLSTGGARLIVKEMDLFVAPRISEELLPQYFLEEHKPATLICLAQGNPPPVISWRKSGVVIPDESKNWSRNPRSGVHQAGGSLVFSSIKQSDSGEYSCTAKNTAGRIVKQTRVLVISARTVVITPPFQQIDVGERLSLKCGANGVTTKSITWFKDGEQIRPDTRVRLLTPEDLVVSHVRSKDAGVYQCRVQTLNVIEQSHAIVKLGASSPILLYRFIAHTLQEGPAVSLKCIAQATPTPTIRWTLDGFELPQSHRYLIGQYVSSHGDVISHVNITNVMVQDGGSFKCIAENSAGRISHSERLNIYGSPVIREMGSQTAVAGETYSVSCPVGGYPIETITWMKGDKVLPISHRQRVDDQGTLFISSVTRDLDQGTYSCTAKNRHGREDSKDLYLQVVVPPSLGTLSFPESTKAGMRMQVTCFVQEGDQPIDIHWEKDGMRLHPSPNIRITKFDDHSVVLVIVKAFSNHSGNYSCVATNTAKTVATTAYLSVNVPPSWHEEPNDTDAAIGDNITLPCSAEGSPTPKITWSRETSSGQWLQIESLPADQPSNIYMKNIYSPDEDNNRLIKRRSDKGNGIGRNDVENELKTDRKGNLQIKNVSRQNEGRYLCKAQNGVEPGLSRVIQISVHEPPWFPERHRVLQVEVNLSADLSCTAHGDEPLTIEWIKENTILPKNSRYSVKPLPSEGTSQTVQLTIEHADSDDSGVYICRATNPHGSTETEFTLLVEDVPSTPSLLSVSSGSSRYVTLSWFMPELNASVPKTYLNAFIISYKKEGDLETSRKEVFIPGSDTGYLIEGLLPATWYNFRIAAQNKIGRSNFSSTLTHKTSEEKPSSPPLNVHVTTISARALKVRWDAPPSNKSHGRLLGYHLGIREHSPEGDRIPYNFTTVGSIADGTSTPETTTIVDNLRPFTRYSIVLQAFNSRGSGPTSEPVTERTQEDKPSSPPKSVRCNAVSSTDLEISWRKPAASSVNGKVISYHITYNANSRPDHTITSFDTVDSFSSSPILYSSKLIAQEHITRGSSVSQVDALRGTIIVDETKSSTISNLLPFTNYSVTVAAATEAGVGVASEDLTCSTFEDVPSAPRTIRVLSSGPHSVKVSWAPPSEPRGLIVHYNLYWNSSSFGSVNSRKIQAHETVYTLKHLPQQNISVWVAGSTSIGEGEPSVLKTAMPSDNIKAAIWSIGGKVHAKWKENINLKCDAVGDPKPERVWYHGNTKMDSYYFNVEKHRMTVNPSGSLHLESVGRNHSGEYSCRVKNKYGSDSVSYNITVMVPPIPPTMHVTGTTSSSIRVQWSVSDNGGSPVHSFTLFYRISGRETVRTLVKDLSYTVTNLKCGTEYDFYLTAHNDIGSSESSPIVKAKTKGDTPEAPPPFQFITSNSSQVTLYLTQWKSGGCRVHHFAVEYRKLNQHQWFIVSNEILPRRTFFIPNLEGGKTYSIRVRATNSAGVTSHVYNVTLPEDPDRELGIMLNSGREVARESSFSWTDWRLLVPVCISATALIIVIVTLRIIVYRRKGKLNPNEKSISQDDTAERSFHDGNQNQFLQQFPNRHTHDAGEFRESDESYQYPSGVHPQSERLTPPPPPAPNERFPNLHNSAQVPDQLRRSNFGEGALVNNGVEDNGGYAPLSYSTLIYQPPARSVLNSMNRRGSNQSPSHRNSSNGLPSSSFNGQNYGRHDEVQEMPGFVHQNFYQRKGPNNIPGASSQWVSVPEKKHKRNKNVKRDYRVKDDDEVFAGHPLRIPSEYPSKFRHPEEDLKYRKRE